MNVEVNFTYLNMGLSLCLVCNLGAIRGRLRRVFGSGLSLGGLWCTQFLANMAEGYYVLVQDVLLSCAVILVVWSILKILIAHLSRTRYDLTE